MNAYLKAAVAPLARLIKTTSFAVAVLVFAIGAAAGTQLMTVNAAANQALAAASADESAAAADAQPPHHHKGAAHESRASHLALDRSGRKQVGKASFYADRYSGKTMADGTPMHLNSNNAASLTLPLGTAAKVTNLATGRSAIVVIRDRGPYVKGRIIDLSPATARSIGLDQKQGVAKVEVAPI